MKYEGGGRNAMGHRVQFVINGHYDHEPPDTFLVSTGKQKMTNAEIEELHTALSIQNIWRQPSW